MFSQVPGAVKKNAEDRFALIDRMEKSLLQGQW
jgi:hypothetical protein